MDNQAQRDLKVKLKFESIFKREIKSLFNIMLNDFKVTYAATGGIPLDGKYNNQWETLLKKHYTRVQKRFTKNVTIEKKQKVEEVEDDDNLNALLLLALLNWQDENSKTGSELIGNTTSKQMRDAVREARDILNEEGGLLNNRNIATTAARVLKRKFRGRVQNITTTETQNVAEATKQVTGEFIERSLIENDEVTTPPVGVVIKTWKTVGDNKVRSTHITANGQTRLLNEAYIVGGQFLKYPGDRSLGANPKETSGCRCSSILSALGKMINFH